MEEKFYLVANITTPVGVFVVRMHKEPGTFNECANLRNSQQINSNSLAFAVGFNCTDNESETTFPGELWENSVVCYTSVSELSDMFDRLDSYKVEYDYGTR